jgi:hypothetical protein
MPWEGYNYEDAIVINERILLEDCLTSVHIEEYETNLTFCVTGNEKLTNDLPHLPKHVKRHLNNIGIVRVGSYVRENDILVGKVTPCEEDPSPEAKLLKALYGQKNTTTRDTSLRVSHGTEGRVIDVRIISTNFGNKEEALISTSSEYIKIFIAQIRKVQIGDKLAGRHGNKGIVYSGTADPGGSYFSNSFPTNGIVVFGFNGMMLLCGYLYEIGILDLLTSNILGFVGLAGSFYVQYDAFAKHSVLNMPVFLFVSFIWSLYGVAAMLTPLWKNITYNIIDTISKNFYAIFLTYVAYKKSVV